MELRHLRSFVAAAELEHFGRAAERLHIVQPALSRQIRELEEEIGAPLFTRLKRGVRLTSAGRALREEARQVLGQLDDSLARVRAVASGREGLLRIGFVDTAVYSPALPKLFDRFRRRHPGVRLELLQRTSLAQAELLRRGEIDLAFVYNPPERLGALEARPLWREHILLAVPARHPLAKRRSVRLADLRDEAFVWIPRDLSPAYYDLVFRNCAAAGFRPNIVQEGGTDSAIMSLVAAGAGLSFCLESSRHHRPAGVALVPIRDLKAHVQLAAVWRTDRDNPALPLFVEMLARQRTKSRS